MVNLIISSEIAERLQNLAEQENRPVDAVLESLLDRYQSSGYQPKHKGQVKSLANRWAKPELDSLSDEELRSELKQFGKAWEQDLDELGNTES